MVALHSHVRGLHPKDRSIMPSPAETIPSEGKSLDRESIAELLERVGKVQVPKALPRVLSALTPADYAVAVNHGRWSLAPHLALLNRKLMQLATRRIRRLIVTMPPRHGKSTFISKDLPGWWLGTWPDERVILGSYGSELATDWSAKARASLEEFGQQLFGIRVSGKSRAGDHWRIEGREGSMKAVGVGGPLTGHGANLLIIDDPVKNAEEAMSPLMRAKTWEWWQTTASTRIEPNGCVIVIITRWHEDDLVGRMLTEMSQGGEKWDILNLPAIAEEDEPSWPNGLGRKRGQALWPERYDVEALETIRNRLTSKWWYAMFQQSPYTIGGGIFRSEHFQIVENYPRFKRIVRFWDLAATAEHQASDPDWTACVKMGHGIDDQFYVLNVQRKRLSPGGIINWIIETAKRDGPEVAVYVEQEGGASGKFTIHFIEKEFRTHGLHRWTFRGNRPQGSKELRADPFSAAAEHQHVFIVVDGTWDHNDYLGELEQFPNGTHDDRVDASTGAYDYLADMASGVGQPAVSMGRPVYQIDERKVIDEHAPSSEASSSREMVW